MDLHDLKEIWQVDELVWDRESVREWVQKHNPAREALRDWEYPEVFMRLDDLHIEPHEEILCVGCSRDWLARSLSEFHPIIGTDYDEAAGKWYEPENISWGEHFRFVHTEKEVGVIPLESKSLSYAFSISALEHSPTDGDHFTCGEVLRILKPGGMFILTSVVHDRHPRGFIKYDSSTRIYSVESAVRAFLLPGFRLIEYVRSPIRKGFMPFLMVMEKV